MTPRSPIEPAPFARAEMQGDFAPTRWAELARTLGNDGELDAAAPLCVALSGGADSVYLLRVIAAAQPRPRVLAVHVDHGLRGAESDADARACVELCAELAVELEVVRAPIAPRTQGLEARARTARYAALARVARAHGIATIATAHHADDALETLLLRLVRGTELAGLDALRPRRALDATLAVVRPLLALRRADIRAALARAGATWREDSSNADARFARNAVRNVLLPAIASTCGPRAIADLHAFERAVADLERTFAARGRTLALVRADAPHAARPRDAGGSIARAELAALGREGARRALARLCAETAGAIPRRAALDGLIDALFAGRNARLQVAGGWRVRLRADRVEIDPPTEATEGPLEAVSLALPVPGALALADGRRLICERVAHDPAADVPRTPTCVEIDARDLPAELVVRTPRPGDRFHPLGATGSKPLVRFLSDAGVPREDRARVLLVTTGGDPAREEIVWVVGVRPGERRRVGSATSERLRMRIEPAAR